MEIQKANQEKEQARQALQQARIMYTKDLLHH